MNELNMLTVHHLITKETIQFIHKILFNGCPEVVYKMITYGNINEQNIRSVRKPRMKKHHKSEKVTQSLFYRVIYLYNLLDYEVKMYNPKKLSKYLQKNIFQIFPNNKIPKFQSEK